MPWVELICIFLLYCLHFQPWAEGSGPGAKSEAHAEGATGRASQQGQEGEQRGHMVLEMKCPHLCKEGQGVLWVSGETSGACPSPFWSKKAPCCLQQAKAMFWSFALMITDKLPDACHGAWSSLRSALSKWPRVLVALSAVGLRLSASPSPPSRWHACALSLK